MRVKVKMSEVPFLAICLVLVCTSVHGQDLRSRFFEKIAKVEKGMSMTQVEDILGEPDDIWKQLNPKLISNYRIKTVWCYGSVEHLDFPALGRVEFGRTGKVFLIVGNKGKPFSREDVDESKLRHLMQLIANAPAFSGDEYNPFELMTIANAFQPLGKEVSFAVFHEYLRVSSDVLNRDDGIYLLLHCLLEVPDKGYLPQMAVGAPEPKGPIGRKQCPRFPLRFVGNIPFLLIKGHVLAGEAQSAVDYLDKELDENTGWAEAPLTINEKSRKSMHVSLKQFRDSSSWYYSKSDSRDIYAMLETQLDRYVVARDRVRSATTITPH